MGEVAPDSGHFDVGETVRFGYYSQEGLQFDEQMKVIDVVQAIAEYVDLGNGQKISTMTIIIKATDKASYKNLIDALDEMQLCSIGKYVIDKINPDDQKLLDKVGVK